MLDKLAARNPDRWVFVTPRGLVELCNGKYREHGEGPYKLTTIEKSLHLFRELGIIGPELREPPSADLRGPGFVVAPHDKLCRRYPKVCRYLGVMIADGTWMVQGKLATWVKDAESFTGGFALVRGQSEQSPAPVRDESGQSTTKVRSRVRQEYGEEYGQEYGEQNNQTPSNVEGGTKKPEVFPEHKSAKSRANPLNPVSQSNLGNQENLRNQARRIDNSDYAEDEQQREEKPAANTSTPCLLTDRSENPQPCATREKLQTVAQYFESVPDAALPDVVTDGLLDRENAAVRRFSKWPQLEKACREAVRREGHRLLRNRHDLAEVMETSIRVLQEMNPRDRTRLFQDKAYPAFWLRIKKRLEVSGVDALEKKIGGTRY